MKNKFKKTLELKKVKISRISNLNTIKGGDGNTDDTQGGGGAGLGMASKVKC